LDQQKKKLEDQVKTGINKCNIGDFWEDFKCGLQEGIFCTEQCIKKA